MPPPLPQATQAQAVIADLMAQAPERDRPDAGDVTDLAQSITAVGLLHPPVVTAEGVLVSGLRRVAACASLGWTEVPVTVATSLSDVETRLRAEWDENAVRQALTPEEAARARQRRAEILQPMADASRREGNARGGLGGNLPPTTEPTGKVRDAAAEGLGYSGRTLDKVDFLRTIADDDATPISVRDAAVQALGEINDGHPIDRAYQSVKATAEQEKITNTSTWTQRDKDLRQRIENGETVVANIRTDKIVIAWAESERKYTRIDRRTPWGNPFEMPADGDRKTVILNYRKHYLPYKPSLDPLTLTGRLLGCWCSPEACHGDVLRTIADHE